MNNLRISLIMNEHNDEYGNDKSLPISHFAIISRFHLENNLAHFLIIIYKIGLKKRLKAILNSRNNLKNNLAHFLTVIYKKNT